MFLVLSRVATRKVELGESGKSKYLLMDTVQPHQANTYLHGYTNRNEGEPL